MTQRAGSDAGFTLIEVLVVLALFSLIGLAGFTTLDTILRVQSGTEARLERLAAIDRALLVFSRDLQQRSPAALTMDDAGLTFSRVGGRRLTYQVADGELLRAAPDSELTQVLLGAVDRMDLRFLDRAGAWQPVWPVDPRIQELHAVELTLWLTAPGPGSVPERVVRLVDLPVASQ